MAINHDKFLTEVTLDPPEKTKGRGRPSLPDEEDCLIVSTIHSAKGMEWKIVHVLNAVDGCIPSDKSGDLDEERRLLYVAMTRAKDGLNLIVPQRFYLSHLGDDYAYASITQFIPVKIQGLFERRNWIEPTVVHRQQGGSLRISVGPPSQKRSVRIQCTFARPPRVHPTTVREPAKRCISALLD